jgi:hypothetical protein
MPPIADTAAIRTDVSSPAVDRAAARALNGERRVSAAAEA